ncbi:MAG: hypothetical protein KDB82_08645 [Planctomycetes bacterium]|nr:hypothetical protein [Planctomycetota bacterium]
MKGWMEARFNWLLDKFGRDRVQAMDVITPTDDNFPFPLDGSLEAGQRMFDLVCDFMDVEDGEAEFELFDPQRMKFPAGMPYEWKEEGAAGYYKEEGYRTVAVSEELLAEPEAFVGTVAHELGHVILIGRRYLDPRETSDHEPLTDLHTAFFGMGIFSANSSLRERQYEKLGMHGWSTSRKGYLDFPMWGYAHALLSHVRGEIKPEWAGFLRPDIRMHYKAGLKYIRKTGDTSVKGQG